MSLLAQSITASQYGPIVLAPHRPFVVVGAEKDNATRTNVAQFESGGRTTAEFRTDGRTILHGDLDVRGTVRSDHGFDATCPLPSPVEVRCEARAPEREPIPPWFGPAYAGGGALLTAILFAAVTRWAR